jgi:hypothetical protein
MNWTPPQYGQPPQPNAAQPQGAPPGQPWQAPPQGQPPPGYGQPPPPQGAPGPYVPPGQAQGYPAPGQPAPGAQGGPPAYPQPQGYGAPPPAYPSPQQGYGPTQPAYPSPQQGYGPPPPQQGGAIAFAPQVLNLDNMQDPDLPPGSHIVVGTGAGGSAASGKMFRVELRIEKSNDPAAVGQIGNYKVWLDRGTMKGGPTAHAQAASKDFAIFAVPASGRQLKDTDLNTANMLVGELANRLTIEGRPLQAIRLGCDVTKKLATNQKPGEPPRYWTTVVFHVLPQGA